MAFKLYVGNYPFKFTKEDIQNLFHDFEGIQVDKIIHTKEKLKSYSFLTCKDIDQVVAAIKTMNGVLVSGRNLIVRASDESLQEYVNLILRNYEASSMEAPFVPLQVMKNKCRHQNGKDDSVKTDVGNECDANNMQTEFFLKRKHKYAESENNSTCSLRSTHSNYQQKYDVNDCNSSANHSNLPFKAANKVCQQTNLRSNNRSLKNYNYSSANPVKHYETKNDKDESKYFEPDSNRVLKSMHKNYYQTAKQTNSDFSENTLSESQKYCQPNNERRDQFETNDRNSLEYSRNNQEVHKKNSRSSCYSSVDEYNTTDSDNKDSWNKTAGYMYQQRNTSSLTWVSVSNFRLGTSIATLYELFSDYKPLKVKIICNTPRKDRILTEAQICFPNRDIAEDVILNFDNTMFEGRIILVNDVEDLTIMNELIGVSHS